MPRSLIVCGFHRSGTSMLMQALVRAGMHAGDRLIPALPSNPDGHFEDSQTVRMHDRWLQAAGTDWCHVGHKPVAPEGAVDELQDIANRLGAAGETWGIKDPRASLFLPEWQTALSQWGDAPMALVAMFRHPARCHHSLRGREAQHLLRTPDVDTIAGRLWQQTERVLRSWLAYNCAILNHVELHREHCVLLSQEALLEGSAPLPVINDVLGLQLDVSVATGVRQAHSRHQQCAPLPHIGSDLLGALEDTWVRLNTLAQIPGKGEVFAHRNDVTAAFLSPVMASAEVSHVITARGERSDPLLTLESLLHYLHGHAERTPVTRASIDSRLHEECAAQSPVHGMPLEPILDGCWPAEDPIARFRLGVRASQSRQWKTAIIHLTESWERRTNPDVLVLLIRAYQECQHWTSAGELAQTGQRLYPQDSRFTTLRVEALHQSGQGTAAFKHGLALAAEYVSSAVWQCLYSLASEQRLVEWARHLHARMIAHELHFTPDHDEALAALLMALPDDDTRAELGALWVRELEEIRSVCSSRPPWDEPDVAADPQTSRLQPAASCGNSRRCRSSLSSRGIGFGQTHENASMRLAMSILVRDEADIIEPMIRFHAAHGVDHFVVTDNGSIDGTRGILERLQLSLSLDIIDEPSHTIDQDWWVMRMARRIQDRGDCDWIIHNDADELWVPECGNLKDSIQRQLRQAGMAAARLGVLSCQRFNMLASHGAVNAPDYAFSDNLHRVVATVPLQTGEQPWSTDGSNSLARLVMDKVLTRVEGLRAVGYGNHDAGHALDSTTCPHITILHYPVRTYAQFERKVKNYGESLARNDRLPQASSRHLRYWYQRFLEGCLREDYAQITFSDARLKALLGSGHLTLDTRVRDFFSGDGSGRQVA